MKILNNRLMQQWLKVRLWYWWNYKATERDKVDFDLLVYGNAIMKDGKRRDPTKYHADEFK